MSPTSTSSTVSTYGWDTVFALPITSVNTAIAQATSWPASFSQSVQGGSAQGTFGAWQVCTGGSGHYINMSLPLSAGQTVYQGTTTTFTNLTVTIQLTLTYVTSTTTPPANATGNFVDLVVQTTSGSSTPPVTVLSCNSTNATVNAVLTVALNTWLNANLADFDHVFATVNLNQLAATGAFQWLLPTSTSYVYADLIGQSTGLLAVVCMTGNRVATEQPQLSSYVIPTGSQAGFLISTARFLQDIVQPNMPNAFQGATADDFVLSADGTTLSLAVSSLMLAPTASNGKQYPTSVTTLDITIIGETIQMHSVCSTEISPGIYSNSDVTHTYCLLYTTNANGDSTLGFQEVGTPVVNNTTSQDPGYQILKWMEIIIGIVITMILGVLTDGVAFIVGAIVVGALVGLATEVPNIIALVNTGDAPDLSLLVFNTTNPITWTDQQNFALNSAALNDSLQLGGSFSATGANSTLRLT